MDTEADLDRDVPSPIDLRTPQDALAWEASALAKRPWRIEFFQAFCAQLAGCPGPVLELGSGPGFLAAALLPVLAPDAHCVLLDFSAAMHDLARRRLVQHAARVSFVQRSFREADWTDGLGPFRAVVTNQAVHELRHKRHASALHAQVRAVLEPGGSYLVCDHFAGDGGMTDRELYMSAGEQVEALRRGGFAHIEQVLCKGGMVLHHAGQTSAAALMRSAA